MGRHPKTRSRAKLLRSLYLWHRYIGLTAALFVIVLSITGLALNHTESLEMDSTYVQSNALLDWYGIHAPETIRSHQAGTLVFSALGDRIYLGDSHLQDLTTPLVGAVANEDIVVLATRGQVTLFTHEGERIETLGSAAGVPAGMKAIGLGDDGGLVIEAAHGYYLTDESFLEWNEVDSADADWSQLEAVPEELIETLRAAYRGSGLTVERIMLDLHSGRILGEGGVWLVDAAAVLFLLLACSGVWLWSRRRASARAHRRKLEKRDHADGQGAQH